MLLLNDLMMILLATLKKVKLLLLIQHRQLSKIKLKKRKRNETYRALFHNVIN